MADTSCFVFVLVWFKYSGTFGSMQMGNGSDVAKSKVKAKKKICGPPKIQSLST